nr:MAG TPA: hypothetical protein [Caudoviricetes sp.]
MYPLVISYGYVYGLQKDRFCAVCKNGLVYKLLLPFSAELSALNAKTDVLESNIAIVDGTFESLNQTTYKGYPAGFNSTNCIIVALQAYLNQDYIIVAGIDAVAKIAFQRSGIIVVVTDSNLVGKPYKILLQKITL